MKDDVIKSYSNKWPFILGALVWFAGINVFAQRGDFSIKLELASVTRCLNDYHHYKGVLAKDTVLTMMSFEFVIHNHTGKAFLFGTNTRDYYQNSEEFYYKDRNYGIIGRFFFMNGEDVIPLFTRYSNITADLPDDEEVFWGGINTDSYNKRMSVFGDLLCRFSYPGSNTKEYIYEYLRQARIVYVPVISDYERWFDMPWNRLSKDEVAYPQDTIEVSRNDPFQILFLWEDEQEFYEVYPYIDFGNKEIESDDDD